jgi:CheY-like chemotaxis protein
MATDPETRIRRILVVDDNVDSAETMAEILKLWGHEVQTAHDGAAALEAPAPSVRTRSCSTSACP